MCIRDRLRGAAARLAALTDGGKSLDEEQVFAYDLAHAAAGLETAKAALAYGRLGVDEARIAVVFTAAVSYTHLDVYKRQA